MGIFDAFRSKEWQGLSPEERATVKKYKTLSGLIDDSYVSECRPMVVQYLFDRAAETPEEIFSALINAASSSYRKEAFAQLADCCLNQPAPFLAAWNIGHTQKFLAALSQENWERGMAFYDKLPQEAKSDKEAVFAGIMKNESSFCLLDFLQNKAPLQDSDIQLALAVAAGTRVAALRDTVSVVSRKKSAQPALRDCLTRLVSQRKSDATRVLLDTAQGLDVNADDGALIRMAALSPDVETLVVLAEHGARVQDYAAELRDSVALRWGVAHAMVRYLDQVLKGPNAPEQQPVQSKPDLAVNDADGYVLSGTDTLAQVKPLLPRGTLTTMFNFTLRQQTVVADTGAAVTMTTVPFSSIEGGLEVVAEKFAALGGDRTLAEAASVIIKKPRLDVAGGK